MKKYQPYFFIILLLGYLGNLSAKAQRDTINLNREWQFRLSQDVRKNVSETVVLPHTWNSQDALSGRIDYKRGIGNYTRPIQILKEWEGKRLYLRFKGANSVAHLFINGRHIGEHKGGYTAFLFDITNDVKYGEENQVLVRVSNSERLDVLPLVGDFNMYGGLYRGVDMIVANPVGLSRTDHGGPGLYLTTKMPITKEKATISTQLVLTNETTTTQEIEAVVQIYDHQGKAVAKQNKRLTLPAQNDQTMEEMTLTIPQPHLWDGTRDPYLYQAVCSIYQQGQLIDQVSEPLGIRSFHVDPDKGFFLNDQPLRLHGVCRHQDRAEVGNALHPQHHREDALLMQEMGVNAVRLAHYPQDQYMYSLMDSLGIIVWAETPFVGPGGYADKGYVESPAFKENARQQLVELIRQQYNHPSICMWGIFNEITQQGDDPLAFVKELNLLAHTEDSTRLTTAASNQSGSLNEVTDLIAWNRYDGWYGASPASLATFLDQMHTQYPKRCIGISEYGAGASIYQQQDSLLQPSPTSRWHPENWQTYYHIENWRIILNRPYIWGSFVWNMFDFGAAHRSEGDRLGINDKGLVTFDRKVRKDAFLFYQTNWRPDPQIHIAGKRNNTRTKKTTSITVFSNLPLVTLEVNGVKMRPLKPNGVKVCTFDQVPLKRGENTIKAYGFIKGKEWIDTCIITLINSQ